MSRAGPGAAPALVLIFCLAHPAPTRADRAALWAETTRAMGHIASGRLSAAVAAIGVARSASAVPELDAAVGVIALAGGKHAAARRQLRRAIERGSSAPLTFYWAARTALHAGDAAGALEQMERAIAVGGDRPALRMGHALVALQLGKTTEAQASLRAVAAAQPNLLDPGLYPTPEAGAIGLLVSVLRGLPDAKRLARTEAHLLWQLGRVLPARARFAALGGADATQMLARVELAAGRPKVALALAGRAISADPDLAAAHGARGEARLALGQPAKAIAELRRAANAAPHDGRVLALLARACREAEKSDCAARFYRYAVKRAGRLAEAHYGRALAEQQQRHHQQAAQSFARAIALAPGTPRYHEAAANLAQLTGDRATARAQLREAARARPVRRRFDRRRQAATALATRTLDALDGCGCAPAGPCTASASEPRCRAGLGRLPPAQQAFFRAHLALVGKKGDVRRLLARAAASLKVRRLLLTDPTLLEQKGKTTNGARYGLTARLPIVPPSVLR